MSKPYDARLACWLVRPLTNTAVSPNHLTTLRLVTGLWGAGLLAAGNEFIAGTALVVLSNFLDHTDGELARLAGRQSRFGHNYDLLADALVTSLLFVGLGVGLRDALGGMATGMGVVAGLAVAAIFHLRNRLESDLGKEATRQPHWQGFEAEDVLYLLPLIALADGLRWFLFAAALGAPMAFGFVLWHARTARLRSNSP